MYRAWAWRMVQCISCSWFSGDKADGTDIGCECGWVRAWACIESRRSRPLSHSFHHESRLQLGFHEHLPEGHQNTIHAHEPISCQPRRALDGHHNHSYPSKEYHGPTVHDGLPWVVSSPSEDSSSIYNKSSTNSVSSTSSLKALKDEMAEVTAEMEALDTGEDSKNNPKSKQMSIGRKKFNMDPKKGIEYLIDHGLLRNTPEDIAQFLHKGEGLNKTAIGDYLGERNEFNQSVLDAFVCLHDFTDLILVQALRQFLWSFRLPGEAQKIDRMMERFAHRYCELNPSIFQHPDTCFVLSFAIIMLNTSLHNPAVKDKQTIEQFIAMNRGIDNGDDLPRELLESLYDSIKTEPFKIPEDDGNDLMHTFFNPDREGWLMKQGGRYKSWKRRWFILNDNCLYYFEYTTDKEPRGIIPLENIEVREVQDRNKPNCFELYATSTDFIKACKTDSEGKVVEGKHTVYRMSAATPDEKEEWIKCIRQSISHNPFYDMLAKRKKNIQKNSSR
ncbi:cytohesin-1 isoform X1 [Macrobrachium rosenbergii]|uniref:cytohesin-1 isoform X1 n=1 Tax=Macrobrachium rosenbergii TaxID=79674 RepID=UPI0034D4073C